MKILVINGPNLNLLSEEINNELVDFSKTIAHDIELSFFQSNHEGEIVDIIQKSKDYDGIIINPAAYTHTSIAIADALRAIEVPCVEVHLSNINQREDYRKISFVSEVCFACISGFKKDSYKLAFLGLYNKINEQRN